MDSRWRQKAAIDVGHQVHTYPYITSTITHMRSMIETLRKTGGKQLIFQKLPRHLRRRAMSHDPKRLPRKYRQIHISQSNKAGMPTLRKRPSRKYRRRPRNLLREYLRRQRKYKWLETHIWHAKRFHMVEKWGYRLPYASCEKTFRSCYRATTKYCLLQDISYYECIEIYAPVQEIQEGFKRLTASPDCGLSIVAKTFLSGRREGNLDLFRDGQYPYKALGKVLFLWRPVLEGCEDGLHRTLWLWMHPLSYSSILEELLKVFDLRTDRICRLPIVITETANKNGVNLTMERREEFMTKIYARLNVPSYSNAHQKPGHAIANKVVLRELGGTMNRFRLTGPSAHRILTKLADVIDLQQDNLKTYQDTWIGKQREMESQEKNQDVKRKRNMKKKQKGSSGKSEKNDQGQSCGKREGQGTEESGLKPIKTKQSKNLNGDKNETSDKSKQLNIKRKSQTSIQEDSEKPTKKLKLDASGKGQFNGNDANEKKIPDTDKPQNVMEEKRLEAGTDIPVEEDANPTEKNDLNLKGHQSAHFRGKRRQSAEVMEELEPKKIRLEANSQTEKTATSNGDKEKAKEQDCQGTCSEISGREEDARATADLKFNAFLKCHRDQKDFWKKCEQTINDQGDLLSNLVVALNIKDPRLKRPHKTYRVPDEGHERMSMFVQQSVGRQYFDMTTYTDSLPYSLLWEEDVRNRISKNFMDTYNYYQLRHRQATVPDYNIPEVGKNLQPIPIILIQRPGITEHEYGRLSYGGGYDLILPAGYGMIFWLNLISWGCKPGGLRETENIQKEAGYEIHLPDTVAGLQLSSERYQELRRRYFRLPPNRRPNYTKLSVISPFRAPFSLLIRDWNKQVQASAADIVATNKPDMLPSIKKHAFYVLRDRCRLRCLADCLRTMKPFQFQQQQRSSSMSAHVLNENCLIPIKVTLKHRGTSFKDFSMLCLPERRDMQQYGALKFRKSNQPIYTEPLAKDPKTGERRRVRLAHKKLLRRLRRRRLREKRRRMAHSTTRIYIAPANTRDLCAKQFARMCKLWLQEEKLEKLSSIRKQGQRDVLGYMTLASYSSLQGTMAGIGYVTLNGLERLQQFALSMRMKQSLLLVRSIDSRHYRFAKFQINVEP